MWLADLHRPPRVLAVGECMLELRHRSALDLHLGFAGDTYNTAVYLRRTADQLGLTAEVGYLTGLGDDPYSEQMRQSWCREGVLDQSRTMPGHQPGLYAVRLDGRGERSFTYWRARSAAATMFAGTDWTDSVAADLVHFSGVTLQLMSPAARGVFFDRLVDLRRAGTVVSLDTNFRTVAWPDIEAARAIFTQFASTSDVVLATFEDEAALFGDADVDESIDRYRAAGVDEIVVKAGAAGAIASEADARSRVAAEPVTHIVDTTAAGDSFAGAYLAARLASRSVLEATRLGNRTAARVIQSHGAIISANTVA